MSQKDIELVNIEEFSGKRIISGSSRWTLGYVTPILVSDFMSEFAKRISPKKILDPCAGIGSSLRLILSESNDGAIATAIECHEQSYKYLNDLSKDFHIETLCGNAIRKLGELESYFDFIVSDLPWNSTLSDRDLQKQYKGIRSDGGAIILKSLEKLADGGYAMFTNVANFFNGEYKEIEKYISELGVSLVGLINIPAGTYYPFTGVAANICIFKKEVGCDDVLIGQLTTKNNIALINNFFNKNKSDDFAGRIVKKSTTSNLLWDAFKISERLEKQEKEKKIEKIEGVELSMKFDFEKENSVFITTFGAPKVKEDLDEDERKGKYIQVILPEKYDKNVFTTFYNSQFGKKYFGVVSSSMMGSVSMQRLREVGFYYPVGNVEKIKIVSEKIDKIKSELSFCEKLFKDDVLGNLDYVYESISKIKLLGDIEFLMDRFPTLISKPYQEYINSKNNGDYSKAIDCLIYLVSSLIMLGVSIMWGGLKTNINVFSTVKNNVLDAVKDFSHLSIGGMINLYATFSSEIRRLMDGTGGDDLVMSVFGINDRTKIDQITDKSIIDLCYKCSKFRNKKKGHGGMTLKTKDKENLECFEGFVFELIKKFGWLKDVTVFLYNSNVSGGIKKLDEYTYEIPCTIFNTMVPYGGKLRVTDIPYDNWTYYSFNDTGKPIAFPSIIRYGESSSDKDKVAYMYSSINDEHKDQLDYLSYESEENDKTYPISDSMNDELFLCLLSKKEK